VAARQLNDTRLLGFPEWRQLVEHLGLRNEIDFREREIALCFVWSRMRVRDERPLRAQAKRLQLSFEDFLEAMVHVARIKTLPTEEQVFEAGCEDAGDFLVQLLEQPEAAVAAFIQANQRAWGAPLQSGRPLFRYVDDIIYFAIRRIESVLMGGGPQFQGAKATTFRGVVRQTDVEKFRRRMLSNLEPGRGF
jgi:hypothetical protein